MFHNKKTFIFLLIGITILAYFSSLGNPFIWDDEQFITSNVYVKTFNVGKIFTASTLEGGGIISNYYRPLISLSFAIDYKIWGLSSFGFHLSNLAFHTAAGVILFLLLLELGLPNVVGFFIALFFLIQPLQTEAVSYINSRGDSLYALFLFGSLFLFALSLRGASATRQSSLSGLLRLARNDAVRGVMIVGLFIASLLSKETAMAGTGLYILISLLFLFRNSKRISRKELLIPAGILLVTGIYFGLRLTVLNFQNTLNFSEGNTEYTRSLAIRLFTFCKALWVYLQLLILPYPLHMERSVGLVESFFSPFVLGILGLFGSVSMIGIWEVVKRKTMWILFGLSWFGIMLVPSSGIIPINGILYEHWLYVPMIGFWITIYGLLTLVGKKIRQYKKILILFGIVISILYIVLTIRQNNIWSDPIGFYSYTLQFAPWSARLHNNLGKAYADNNNTQKAIFEYKKALALSGVLVETHNNLANVYRDTGKYDASEQEYKKALKIAPQFTIAKINLLQMYVMSKQINKALPLFKDLSPQLGQSSGFEFQYGKALWATGRNKEAEKAFDEALLLNNNDPQMIQDIENAKSK